MSRRNYQRAGGLERLALILLLTLSFFVWDARTVRAESMQLPYASDNSQYIYQWKYSGMIPTDTGSQRIFVDEEGAIYVEEYNDSFELQKRITLSAELQYFGGFFAGANYNFLVFGQNNTDEDTSKEVIRIVKYSKSWKRLGAANLKGDSDFGHEIRYPFHAGNVSLAEYGGKLFLATGHEGYVDPMYNQGHQGRHRPVEEQRSDRGNVHRSVPLQRLGL